MKFYYYLIVANGFKCFFFSLRKLFMFGSISRYLTSGPLQIDIQQGKGWSCLTAVLFLRLRVQLIVFEGKLPYPKILKIKNECFFVFLSSNSFKKRKSSSTKHKKTSHKWFRARRSSFKTGPRFWWRGIRSNVWFRPTTAR